MLSKVKILAVILVLLIGYKLRIENFDKVPLPGQSMDEYSYSWVGMSLLETGTPIGISGIDGYKVYDYRYINVDRVFQSTAYGNPVSINKPWFDHPPLLGLVTGGFAYIKGARVFEDAGTYLIRKPMVYLGVLTVLVVFLLGNSLGGFGAGIISSLIYATSPVIVIGSRMIQAENGMIPFFLLSLWFYVLASKNAKHNYLFLILAGIFSGIAILFKLSGVASLLTIYLMLFLETNKKETGNKFILVTAVAGSIASLFVIYGLSIDKTTFMNVFLSNGSRFYGIGTEAFFRLLTQVKLTNDKFLTDAWIISGWIAFFVLSFLKNVKGRKIIIIGGLSYLVIYIFLGSYPYGWYTFPFWPFLALSLGVVLNLGFNKRHYLAQAFLLILLPAGYVLSRLISINDFQKYSAGWKIGIVAILICLLLMGKKKEMKTGLALKAIMIVLFGISIYLNYRYLKLMTLDYWYSVN